MVFKGNTDTNPNADPIHSLYLLTVTKEYRSSLVTYYVFRCYCCRLLICLFHCSNMPTVYSMPHLFHICSDKIRLMKFLCDSNLINRRRRCLHRNCRRYMCLIRDRSSADHFRFRCPKCKSLQSVRKGSFFEQTRLTIPQALYITCCWACKVPVKSASFMSNVCDRSVSLWYAFLREKCSESLMTTPNYSFGGPGVVVQIDESLVAKRKYNVGHLVQPQWVFGLYDTSTKLGHIQLVDDRSAGTLIPIIQRCVRPGTTIFSDQWSAYRGLQSLGYVHHTVNHSQNFIDPNTGTCTNAIEAYWSRVKRNIKLHWLSRRDQLPLRIDEFLWRDRLPTRKYCEAFNEMLRLMAHH